MKSALPAAVSVLLCSAAQAQEKPVPDWVFDPWVWEDESTQESALALVNGYLSRGIPVGAVIIDSPWETEYNSFEFDTTRYPAPRSMVEALHGRGVRVILWATSMVNRDTSLFAEAKDFLMRPFPGGPAGTVPWWKGTGGLLDYFNPEAVTWWHGLLDRSLALGIDGWKVDGVDPYAYFTPYSPGAKRFVSHREYADKYYTDFFEYTRAGLGSERIITARPVDFYGAPFRPLLDRLVPERFAHAPRDVNRAGWVGDQPGTFAGLRRALENMRASARMRYLAFGSDIGGYNVDRDHPLGRSREVFLRWAQLGAFSPIMENGGIGEHRPWMFDDETVAIYRHLVCVRQLLKPYLVETAAKAWAEKVSMMSFVGENSFAYHLGADVFVAPIADNDDIHEVTLPAGTWIPLYDWARTLQGGERLTRSFALREAPVFLRADSAVGVRVRGELSRGSCGIGDSPDPAGR